MPLRVALSSKRNFIVIMLCLVCVIFLGARGWSPSSTVSAGLRQGINPYVTNKTQALQVTGVTKVGEGASLDVEVTLVNQSSKGITAFVLSTGSVSVTTQIGLDGAPFAPGDVRTERVPYSNLEHAASKNPNRAGEIVLSAALTSDGTGEGEPQWVAKLKNRYMGMKDGIKLILPILRNSLNSAENDPDLALQQLEAQASQIPAEEGNDKVSPDYRSGRNFVRERLKSTLKGMRNKVKADKNFNHRMSLKALVEHHERFLSIL
jgi:hypothetical protein